MVKAKSLSPANIISSMEKGDFYSSSGITISEIKSNGRVFSFKIKPEDGVSYTTRFIGTRKNFKSSPDKAKRNSTKPSDAGIGVTLGQAQSLEPSYTFKGDELYVRAEVTSSKKKANPYVAGEFERAWLQPVQPSK